MRGYHNPDGPCARCGCDMYHKSSSGDSQLYHPGNFTFLLCEPCFDDEDAEVEERGTNVIPERIDEYKTRLKNPSVREQIIGL